ncbi:hypothetical protein A2U01_0071086, partial [Trifolium medium]|nr:hypothetical protein [Trifolium medium]
RITANTSRSFQTSFATCSLQRVVQRTPPGAFRHPSPPVRCSESCSEHLQELSEILRHTVAAATLSECLLENGGLRHYH